MGRRRELVVILRLPFGAPLDSDEAAPRFRKVTQDGDEEGCLRLHELPTAKQAVAIREALGIRKRREMTADELARVRSLFKRRVLGAGSAGEGCSVPNNQET